MVSFLLSGAAQEVAALKKDSKYFFKKKQIFYMFNLADTAQLSQTCILRTSIRTLTPMRLTAYTDYTLRTLIYLAMQRERLVTIQDIADLHGISKNHLMKVVYQLGQQGLVETIRGRNGGMRLAREPADINIGDVVRGSETDFTMAECFDAASNSCTLAPGCTLKGVLGAATAAYLDVLDAVTLADLVAPRAKRPATANIVFRK